MKKAIAMILGLLILTFAMTGCGGKNTENVSENDSGMIEDDAAARSGVERSMTPDRNDHKRERSVGQDVMDDMKDAAKDAADGVQDIGRGINDTLEPNDTAKNH